jgi:hypothetical protein
MKKTDTLSCVQDDLGCLLTASLSADLSSSSTSRESYLSKKRKASCLCGQRER